LTVSDDRVNARLAEYLRQYTSFQTPDGDVRSHRLARSTAVSRALPGGLVRGVGGTVLALAIAATLIVVLVVGLGLRTRMLTSQSNTPTLFGGPAVASVADPRNNYVWFTGADQATVDIVPPSQSSGAAGLKVAVLDWTGAVRYRFTIGRSRLDPSVFPQIDTISADGTRALLSDGTVINQTGAGVGSIPALANLTGTAHWTNNSREVCAANDAGGRLSLRVFSLDGPSQLIASVPDASAGAPGFPSIAAVLACDPAGNLAVVARYRYGGSMTEPVPCPPPSTCSVSLPHTVVAGLWAIRMSNGAVALREPDVYAQVGRSFFYGSENGALVAEFLIKLQAGNFTQPDAVVRVSSGRSVASLAQTHWPNAGYFPDIPAISADGSLLISTSQEEDGHVTMDLVRGASGVIVRSYVFVMDHAVCTNAPATPGDCPNPASTGSAIVPLAHAAAYPGGSAFMVDVDGELALIDAHGDITRLQTTLNLEAPAGDPGYDGMSQAQR
jgi:hypothetical protein